MKKKVLIVEDEVLIGMMLSNVIKKQGFDVQEVVTTGEAAIASVLRTPPDAILMDISLTGTMDGIDAAAAIKAEHDIPILFFTGYQDKELMQRVRAVKPAAVLNKLDPIEAIEEAFINVFK